MNNIKNIRKQQKISVTKLASLIGMSQANLTKIENNQLELKIDLAKKIAQSLNVSLESVLNNKPDNQQRLKLINPEILGLPQYSSIDIPNFINTSTVKGYILTDDAMENTFPKHSIALLDTTENTPENGIFLISINNNLILRRLQKTLNNTLFIIPENKSYQTEETTPQSITIIAKAKGVISYTLF